MQDQVPRKMTRRDLGKAALVAASLGTLAPTGHAIPSPDAPNAAAAIIEHLLGKPMDEELRAYVQAALKDTLATWNKLNIAIPDGTEPAFVFQPVPARISKERTRGR